MKPSDLLQPKPQGLYCPPGDFFIDPVRPVDVALVTHGHADHARPGNRLVVATPHTLDIMAIRYGQDFCSESQQASYGETFNRNGVEVTFFPAGHVLGSAQIRVAWKGMTIVASGDYKRSCDPTVEPFEPVSCDVFISEATFGLPVFRFPEADAEVAKVLRSREMFPERSHLIGAYGLGKAQRMIKLIRQAGYDRPIYIHGALQTLCDYYQGQGIDLGELLPATVETRGKRAFAGEIVLGPPSAVNDKWSRRFSEPLNCFASGWMQLRQRARQRGIELPLIISDHADWDDLTRTIRETGASELWVTHGSDEALVRWAELNQLRARPLHLVGYESEAD